MTMPSPLPEWMALFLMEFVPAVAVSKWIAGCSVPDYEQLWTATFSMFN